MKSNFNGLFYNVKRPPDGHFYNFKDLQTDIFTTLTDIFITFMLITY